MIEKFIQLVKDNVFEDIYVTGFVYEEDDGKLEFCLMPSYLYFQFGEQFIEIEDSDQTAKFHLIQVDSIQNRFDMFEDTKPCQSSISDIIFKASTSIVSNRVKQLSFYGLESTENEIIFDALHIKLESGQDLFLAPSFFGINIGGLELREDWIERLKVGNLEIPKMNVIELY